MKNDKVDKEVVAWKLWSCSRSIVLKSSPQSRIRSVDSGIGLHPAQALSPYHNLPGTTGCPALKPPQTFHACPFTQLASSLPRKSATLATSSATAPLRIGFSCPTLLSEPRARAASYIGAVMPVSMRPGQIALQRILVPASWQQVVCISEMTAALDAEQSAL